MRQRRYSKSMDSVIISKYQDEKTSMAKIAEELNIAVGTVYNVCKRYGVKSRPQYEGFLGKTHNADARAKISVAQKGKTVSQETKNKIADAKKIHGIGHKKRRCDGYISIYYPDYPKCAKNGYVMEHVYIMEQHLGRLLTDDEIVHHINKKRDDNRLENLMVMTKSEHMSMHSKERHANKNKGE